MRRKLSVLATSGAVFLVILLAMYTPFLLAKRWDYFQGVFIASFTSYPVTQANAFNFWALGPVVSSHAGIGGVSCARIGQVLYLASLAWLGWRFFRVGLPRNDPRESARMFLLVAAYVCVAPFMVLTGMHERYIAPAIAFLVLTACLDRRLWWLAVGFSVTYALNLFYVLRWLETGVARGIGDPQCQRVRFADVLFAAEHCPLRMVDGEVVGVAGSGFVGAGRLRKRPRCLSCGSSCQRIAPWSYR